MHTIKIEIKEGNALVFTPYNGKFVSMVRAIGKWSGDAWEVPVSKLDDVKKMLNIAYGYDAARPDDFIHIEVTTREELWGGGYRGIVMFGRSIARAFDRDSGVSIGEGISFLHGEAVSGGSAKHWGAIIEKGSTFILYDVPKGALELKNNYREYIDINVVQPSKEISVELLLKEKESLLKSLAEIDRLLKASLDETNLSESCNPLNTGSR